MPTPSLTPGQRVILRRRTPRGSRAAVIDEVVVTIEKWHGEEMPVLVGHEESRYCFVEGYPKQGRDIFARNPYGPDGRDRDHVFGAGGTNSYLIGDEGLPSEWVHVGFQVEHLVPEAGPVLPPSTSPCPPHRLPPASASRFNA